MTSIEPSDTNTLVIVDGVNSSGSGDLFNQEVTVLGNSITISSGTDATYGTHLDITFTGSGNMEKLLDDAVTSVTVDTQALSNKYVVMTVLDPSQTQVIAKKQIGYTDFPQKAVMQFSSGVGQTLRIEAVDGFDLYNVYADAGIMIKPPVQYVGIYISQTSATYGGIMYEIYIDTSAGRIGHTSGGGDLSLINDDISTNVVELIPAISGQDDINKLFDGATTGGAVDRMYYSTGTVGITFYLIIPKGITITGGKFWDFGLSGQYAMGNISLYTTEEDPQSMANPSDISNWTLAVSNITRVVYGSAYP